VLGTPRFRGLPSWLDEGCGGGRERNPVDDFVFVAARNAPVWRPKCHFLLTSQLFWGFLRFLQLEPQLFRVFLIVASVANVAEYLIGPIMADEVFH
jgi:hypothetical protein